MIASSRPSRVEHKSEAASLASQVVTEIDKRSEEIILKRLRPTLARFELGLLSEETEDDGGRLTADHFWCVDPLDGTLPFIEGVPGYAVSIALVGRDGSPWIGVAYDPVDAVMWHAVSGVGLFRNGVRWRPGRSEHGQVLSVYVGRSWLARDDADQLIAALDELAGAAGLGGAQVHSGAGAVMNACAVLANPPACYLSFPAPSGGLSLWDVAATACLFRAAGSVVTDIHGDPLELNRDDSCLMNHRGVLFTTDEAIAARLRALYAELA